MSGAVGVVALVATEQVKPGTEKLAVMERGALMVSERGFALPEASPLQELNT
jgi:hypothetical protein